MSAGLVWGNSSQALQWSISEWPARGSQPDLLNTQQLFHTGGVHCAHKLRRQALKNSIVFTIDRE